MKKLHDLMEGNSLAAHVARTFILVLIISNIVAVILDSYTNIHGQLGTFFSWFEIFSVLVFTVEYVLRVLISPFLYGESYSLKSVIRYIVSPLAIIDLLSILPFYLPFFFSFDLRMIRVFRVFRLIRVLKIERYSRSLDLVVRVLKAKRTDLFMVLIIISTLLLLCGSAMYFIENEVQPEVFPNILDSAIWSLRTMVFSSFASAPVTPTGKIVGLLITLLGLGWISLPISIISSGFVEEIENRKNQKKQ